MFYNKQLNEQTTETQRETCSWNTADTEAQLISIN